MSLALESTTTSRAGVGPRRVCVITDCAHGIGGMQRHTHDLVRGLIEAGHEVEVICPADPSLDPRAHGARWHLVDTPGRTDKHWPTKFRATYLEADGAQPFDVVHSESTAALGLLFKPKVATPIVVKYHGNYISLTRAHVRRALQRPRTAPREAKGFVDMTIMHFGYKAPFRFRSLVSMAPSYEQAKDSAHATLMPARLMHVVPNGIDAEMFRPRDRDELRARLNLPRSGRLLVSVGRLNREKGFDLAIESFARVAGDHADVSLVAVGDGDQEEALRRLSERLGVSERVLFVGAQPPERVADYLAASDVFLFSTRRHEAGPIVLLEGMSCGLPTIATRIGGNTEVVAPAGGVPAGLLVSMGDAAELESAIRRVLTDEGLATTLGQRARNRILDEYTIGTMIERTVAIYHDVIARERAAA